MLTPLASPRALAALLLVLSGCTTVDGLSPMPDVGETGETLPATNACGGDQQLRLDVEPVEPGDACGCGGRVECTDVNTVR